MVRLAQGISRLQRGKVFRSIGGKIYTKVYIPSHRFFYRSVVPACPYGQLYFLTQVIPGFVCLYDRIGGIHGSETI
jgi:hypothetical protein